MFRQKFDWALFALTLTSLYLSSTWEIYRVRLRDHLAESSETFVTSSSDVNNNIKACTIDNVCFLNGPTPVSFLFIWGIFKQTNNKKYTTNQCEKCHLRPVNGDGIRTSQMFIENYKISLA